MSATADIRPSISNVRNQSVVVIHLSASNLQRKPSVSDKGWTAATAAYVELYISGGCSRLSMELVLTLVVIKQSFGWPTAQGTTVSFSRTAAPGS